MINRIKMMEKEIQDLKDNNNKLNKEIHEKFQNINNLINNIQNKINHNNDKDNIFNSAFISDKYDLLDNNFKNKLIDGNTIIGVKTPKKYYKENKVCNDSTYTMCFFYKAGTCKSYTSIIVKEDQKEYLISNRAEVLYIPLLANIKYRNLSANDLGKEITKFMMCAKCAKNCGIQTQLLFNFLKKKNMCVICKVVSASKNIGQNKLCSDCNRCAGIGNEHLLVKAMQPVVNMFNKILSTVIYNNIQVSYDNDKRIIDLLINGNFLNQKFHIIIEKDENKHKGYNKNDEIKKIITQIKATVKNNDKAIVFRYSSKGKVDGILHPFDNHVDRLVVLRQWIIRFCIKIIKNKLPNNTAIIYLWYDKFNTNHVKNYIKNVFNLNINIIQTNYIPANNNDINAWTYAFDPEEINNILFKNNRENIKDFDILWYQL